MEQRDLYRNLLLTLTLFLVMSFTAADAAPRYQAMECRGGGAMVAEYQDRRGSSPAVLTIRFVRTGVNGDLPRGSCRLRQGEMRGSDPTVLVYRASGEQITQLRIAPAVEVTGVVGANLKRLIDSIRRGFPFTVWVANSGRGWWEVQRVGP